MIKFRVLNSENSEFPHYWEKVVGSCHAYTALRADYQKQLKKAHDECGFKYVRFHGLFNDDMSVVVDESNFGEEPRRYYNFVNIDKIVDFLLDIGMKPFFELSFMPTPLASEKTYFFWYKANHHMPKDMGEWKKLIKMFTQHLLDRYGKNECEQWFFEVWNEPNLPLFFSGTKEDYFSLYKATAEGIKEICPELKVGGPATSFNSWIPEMIEFCENGNVPLDFITTHHYPTDDPLWRSGADIEDFFRETGGKLQKYGRGVLKEMTEKTRTICEKYPLYYTEWNVASSQTELHDNEYCASMVVKTIADNDGLVDGYSFWTFTDIFEEFGQHPGEFYGGFGMQTVHGIAKPVYRAFQLLHECGNLRYKTIVTDNSEFEGNLELLALKKGNGLRLFAYNHNVPEDPIKPEIFRIELDGFDVPVKTIIRKIDNDHANAFSAWKKMGVPLYISKGQEEKLNKISEMTEEPVDINEEMTIPPYALYVIDIDF